MSTSTADPSVRVAWRADAPSIAAVQVAAWRATYADLLPGELLAGLPAEEFERHWGQSIGTPKEARQRVLVAVEGPVLHGFTTTAPSSDQDADPGQDAEVGDIVVHPDSRGRGHGSRLLHAAVDTMTADGFGRATIWVASTDDSTRGWLTGQGWAPDGAYRELDLAGDGAVTVKQVRLHTRISDT